MRSKWCSNCENYQEPQTDGECPNCYTRISSPLITVPNGQEWHDNMMFRVVAVQLSHYKGKRGIITVVNISSGEEQDYAVEDATKISPGPMYSVVPLEEALAEARLKV